MYEEKSYTIDGLVLKIKCYTVLPPDEAVALLEDETDATNDYTGQVVWNGCEFLCQYLIKHKELVHNRTVVELGAGTGLVSCVAALCCEAASVMVTDGNETTLDLLRQNVDSCITEHATPSSLDRVHIKKYLWGDAVEDWCPPETSVVLAADVLYAFHAVQPLFASAAALLRRAHMGGQQTRFVLCCVPRGWDVQENTDIHLAVLENARKCGFVCETTCRAVKVDAGWEALLTDDQAPLVDSSHARVWQFRLS
eukprot:TRINITY_DN68160_c2_g1_i1.p1 TRINITY_DN68160_c2_g1~~TRINITY_DN68160_c2_g1_i1.p1  ORF type:complete len:253 (-),score=21.65 TRINITY_DN68160_c2_g1_i1:402-1160(-)